MPAVAQRCLIAEKAGRQGKQREHHADGNRSQQNVAGVARDDKRPECDQPRAHAVELKTMRAITENVAKCGSIAKYRTEIERMAGRGPRLEWREHQTCRDHRQRTEAGHEEGIAPAKTIRDKLGDEKREADADGKARGIERDAARGFAGRKAVGERLQARHICAAKADAREAPPQ